LPEKKEAHFHRIEGFFGWLGVQIGKARIFLDLPHVQDVGLLLHMAAYRKGQIRGLSQNSWVFPAAAGPKSDLKRARPQAPRRIG
jgi:hypothetical protein